MTSSRSHTRKKTRSRAHTAKQQSRPPAAGRSDAAASGISSEKLSNVEKASLQVLAKIITNLEGTRTSLDITILELQQLHDLAARATQIQQERQVGRPLPCPVI
jgi:hypothetical protein